MGAGGAAERLTRTVGALVIVGCNMPEMFGVLGNLWVLPTPAALHAHLAEMVRLARALPVQQYELDDMGARIRRHMAGGAPAAQRLGKLWLVKLERYEDGTATDPLRLAYVDVLSQRFGALHRELSGYDPYAEDRAYAIELRARMAKDLVVAHAVSDHPSNRVNGREPIGERLVVLRKRAGLSQESLAVKAQVTVASIREYEHDRRIPHRLTVRALAKALGVRVRELTG